MRSLERNSELQRDTIQQAQQNFDHVKREFATLGLDFDTHVVVSAYRPEKISSNSPNKTASI